jgi:exosortase
MISTIASQTGAVQRHEIGQLPVSSILWFSVVCILPVLAASNLMRALFSLCFKNDTYTHIPLIPLVSAFLIYTNRNAIFTQRSTEWRPGAALILFGAFLILADRFDALQLRSENQISLVVLGLVVFWIGAFGVFFGFRALWAARFPLLFMLFMVPIPEPVLSKTIYLLQVGSAKAAAGLFGLFGIPYLQNGLIFSLPGVAIRVAEECSGIRSTLALLIMTVLAGHMFLKATWKQVVVYLLAVPLSVAKNGLRIATLSALAIYVDPSFLHGRLHQYGGMFFFAAAFLPLAGIFVLLQKADRVSRRPRKTLC